VKSAAGDGGFHAQGPRTNPAPRFWTVRRQLSLLFGVLLVAGASVIVLDEIYQRTHEATLTRLYDNALGGQSEVKALTDAYGIDAIGVTFKVRNGLMSWSAAVQSLDADRARIAQAIAALHAEELPPRQLEVMARIDHERASADAALGHLHALLEARDLPGLGRFADTELFPALDPLLGDLDLLSDLKILDAEQQLRDDSAHAHELTWWRLGLSALALLIVAFAGRRVLRNIYRGIEQMVGMAQGMSAGDFDVHPGKRVPGEIGEVMDVFSAMRTDIKHTAASLRDSEARAQEASRAKSSFLAAMSHEIRTPMIGITGMLELLEHTRLDAEQRRCVNIVQSSAQSLLQIIGDILDFSKIEAGRMQLAPENVDLRRLLSHTVHNFLGIASSKGLTLELVLDEALAPAYVADPLRLRQILSNFLSNALKFTLSGGVIVRAEILELLPEGRQRIALRVRDSGIGISDEQRTQLFQPFSQADSGTARQFGGTGLGLAICRQLAHLMDGQIELASQPGAGSTFSLIVVLALGDPAALPRDDHEPGEESFPTRALPSVEQAEQERSLVLVVDDHPTNREVLTRQLARAGYACETSFDGEDALGRWKSGRYALVLADIHMPRMDGYQLTAAIRRIERAEHRGRTPIVAITANVSKGEPERCLEAGMDDFLGKPLRIAQLATTLHRWLPHVVFDPRERITERAPRPPAEALFDPLTDILSAPQAPIDQEVLKEIAGDDRVLARNLLRDFLLSAHRDLHAMREALHAENPGDAAREAHRMKGAAALVGARDVRAAAGAVESAGRAGDLESARIAERELASSLDTLALWIDA
jgi:signal transduction histidine kinase/CheY-like chemotaxis protein/HPt (histidine-containing phosphotransfer) domain-containing protein